MDTWGKGGFGFKSTAEMVVRSLLADERLAQEQVFSLKDLDESGRVHILNPSCETSNKSKVSAESAKSFDLRGVESLRTQIPSAPPK